MKLVADVDTINSNLSKLTPEVESFSTAVSSFDGASINCTLSEISGVLNDYKNSIGTDLKNLNTSSKEYTELVDKCCNRYKDNEGNIQDIDAQKIIDIIKNAKEITFDYKGNADLKLTGLPSTKLYLTAYYDPDFKYLEGGLPIPYFNQGDYGNVRLGGSNVASSGCGFTSCAMIVSYLTRQKVTPKELAKWSQGYYVSGAGMSWGLPAAAAKHYGLGTVRQTSSASEVYKALKEGKAVMSSQRSGLFTRSGHLIVLRGLDDKGRVLVNDPNGKNAYGKGYNKRAFSMKEINQSAAQYWIFEADGENVKV